jgi:hypothetical protein
MFKIRFGVSEKTIADEIHTWRFSEPGFSAAWLSECHGVAASVNKNISSEAVGQIDAIKIARQIA